MIPNEIFISVILLLAVFTICKSHQTSDEPENTTLPRFKFPNRMHRLTIKPVGNTARLKCIAEGNPEPNITWYKNGTTPVIRLLGIARIKNWSLMLEDLKTQDNGNYACNVCNIKGCISFVFDLEVIERLLNKPIFNESPKNQTKIVGEDAEFKCDVYSDRPHYIRWTWSIFDSYILLNRSVLKGEVAEVLKIKNVTNKDEGFYTCTAGNIYGHISAKAYLSVIHKSLRIDDGFPGNKTGFVNSTVVFKCPTQAASGPLSKVWYKVLSAEFNEKSFNHRSIHTMDKSKLFENDTVLIMENISIEDKGWYICVVFGDGEMAFAKGYLNVKECKK